MSSFHCSWWIRETCQTCKSPAPRGALFPRSRCPERQLLAGATRRAGWLAGDARPFSRPVLVSWPQVLTRTPQADGNASSRTAPRSLAQVAGSIGPGAQRPSALYWVLLPVFREDPSMSPSIILGDRVLQGDRGQENHRSWSSGALPGATAGFRFLAEAVPLPCEDP